MALVVGYYLTAWDSLGEFVTSIDHCNLLFCDFVNFYYPMSQRIIAPNGQEPMPGYYYSSFFAIMLSPLGALDVSMAILIWGAFQVASVVALIFCQCLALCHRNHTMALLSIALTLTSLPVLHNLKWGQISVFIVVLILAASLTQRRGYSLAAGALLGLAASLKFYPVAFLLLFVVKKDYRAVASFFAVMFLLYVLVPVCVMGPVDWFDFERTVQLAIAGTDWTFDPNSQYLSSVIRRYARNSSQDIFPFVTMCFGVAVSLATVVLLWRSRNEESNNNVLASVGLLFLLTPFAIETSWPHYFVYLPACQLAATMPGRPVLRSHAGMKALWFTGVGLSIVLSNIVLFNTFSSWRSYSSSSCVFLSNLVLLLLACFLTLNSVFRWTHRDRKARRNPRPRYGSRRQRHH